MRKEPALEKKHKTNINKKSYLLSNLLLNEVQQVLKLNNIKNICFKGKRKKTHLMVTFQLYHKVETLIAYETYKNNRDYYDYSHRQKKIDKQSF